MAFGDFINKHNASGSDLVALKDIIYQNQAVIEFTPDGRVLSANDNFLKVMGYGLGEIKDKHHRIFVTPDYANSAEYVEFWKTLANGMTQKGEFRRRNKAGAPVYIEAAYMPVRSKSGKVEKIIKVGFDVTARKLKDVDTEGKVAAIERAQAVIEFDLNGIVLRANDKFLAAMGYEAREIVGQPHRMFVPSEFARSPAYADFWTQLNAGKYISDQFKRIGKGGREVYIQASYNPIFDVDGKPVKIVKFATDVTERVLKDAEYSGQVAAIQRSQAVIEFALDGTVLAANDKFLNLMGYQIDDIQGHPHRMFVDAATAASEAYAEFWRKLAAGEFISGEFRRVTRDGSEVYIQASYNAIYDLNGKPWKVIKYASDVTARRVALNRTTELSRSLQDLSAAIEEMAASGRSIAQTMDHTRTAAEQAKISVDKADHSARELTAATNAMDGIVDMIAGITSQINLLALNATIEAARAGEAGRGFAVVATEVKTLASQAKKANDQIMSEIAGVRAGAQTVFEALNAIRRMVEDVQDQVVFTAGAVEEQSATSQDMSRNMQIASEEADNIVQAAAFNG